MIKIADMKVLSKFARQRAAIKGIKGRTYIFYIQFTLFWLLRITLFCTGLLESTVYNFITLLKITAHQ